MNTDALRKVADAIKRNTLGMAFNMKDWGWECGTSACIAGWAVATLEPAYFNTALLAVKRGEGAAGFESKTQRLFALTRGQARSLCYGYYFKAGMDATAADAVDLLQDMADHPERYPEKGSRPDDLD